MRDRKNRAAAALALGALLTGGAMIASAQQQQEQQPPQQGQPGGGRRGGGGFGGRQAPFAGGTITAIDKNTGRLTLQSPFGNQTQTVQLTQQTQLYAQNEIAVSDLKVGDTVRVQGVPTGIRASVLSVGQPPD
ncbi:MAG TPA: DUF5666 domain-containing protein, partial [Armatimonadaceae bacterium]|nr:DUF5666 domain-containing protein [Armatimonadaceae bacterium]